MHGDCVSDASCPADMQRKKDINSEKDINSDIQRHPFSAAFRQRKKTFFLIEGTRALHTAHTQEAAAFKCIGPLQHFAVLVTQHGANEE